MPKVIPIRDVPNRVHVALAEAAAAEGLSLTAYLQRELTWLADQRAIARHNLDVIQTTRTNVRVVVDDQAIADALAGGRADP
jgi:hypothetical protein